MLDHHSASAGACGEDAGCEMPADRISRFTDSLPEIPPRRPGIACPFCSFSPRPGLLWHCWPDGCGGDFDTFETHARCPHCDAQFAWTACPDCGKISAHKRWYRNAET